MHTQVYLSELVDAFEWVSFDNQFDNAAYVSRQSGRIFWHSASGEIDEELPEDIEDGTLYVGVPHKHDLDLGQRLVFDFVEAHIPDAYDQVRGYFSRRGAYSRFKDFLERRDRLEAWYSYQEQATEAALREWAESEEFEVVEGRRTER
jgi:hypothetical protein